MAGTDPLEQLMYARDALLAVHAALVEEERRRYERLHGRVAGPSVLLNLLLHDPWFAWLRPVSGLIAEVDRALQEEPPVEPAAAQALIDAARALVKPDESGADFARRYANALQESPDVLLAHGRASRLLSL